MEAPLADLALGDIVVLPDGRAMTVRSRVDLPSVVGSMSSFVIAGELEVLLSAPARNDSPILVYVPIDYLPETARNAVVAYEGVTNYWAPHLPGVSGAMGELLFRVVSLRGAIDPIVIVYRGPEVIVFIRATYADSKEFKVLYMRRDVDTDMTLDRHAGVVSPATIPVPDIIPERTATRTAARPLPR
jgi:hypothetical protein